MAEKKNLLTDKGLKTLEDELQELRVVKRKEVAQKIKEAREQGDLSENAEYDAAKDEQKDIEARIEELEGILKNVEGVARGALYRTRKLGCGKLVAEIFGKVCKIITRRIYAFLTENARWYAFNSV